MSVQTLYTAATGMEAMEAKLDVVANNLANVNTTAFKKGRANFEDLFYRHEVMPGVKDQNDQMTATGTSIGLGAAVSSAGFGAAEGPWICHPKKAYLDMVCLQKKQQKSPPCPRLP